MSSRSRKPDRIRAAPAGNACLHYPSGSAFELAPDWICEVPSPSTASTDRAVKVPTYARESVGHIWLVDPLLQTLEILRLDGPGYRLAGAWRGDVVVQCEPSRHCRFDSPTCGQRRRNARDVWVEASPENSRRVIRALKAFGPPIDKLDDDDEGGQLNGS